MERPRHERLDRHGQRQRGDQRARAGVRPPGTQQRHDALKREHPREPAGARRPRGPEQFGEQHEGDRKRQQPADEQDRVIRARLVALELGQPSHRQQQRRDHGDDAELRAEGPLHHPQRDDDAEDRQRDGARRDHVSSMWMRAQPGNHRGSHGARPPPGCVHAHASPGFSTGFSPE